MKKHPTESEMRAMESPWPKSLEELHTIISDLTERPHDYGTCVYAMSIAAVAAMNYVSHKLGTTGFQSSCADLDILRRARLLKGPFMIVKLEDALYPQLDLGSKVQEFIDKSADWLREEAKKKLEETGEASVEVMAHWMRLAGETGNDAVARLKFQDEWQSNRTEAFVEENAPRFIEHGMRDVYLYEDGSPEKAESVKEGCSFRLGMPVSLHFERNVSGVKLSWSVDTEEPGSAGASQHRFNWGLLENIYAAVPEGLKPAIHSYIEKARAATA